MILSATISLVFKWPEPIIPDEFSYLLAADTFSHGRMTNSMHPMWEHFESLLILQQPSYASRFPPGQGLVLAAGRLLGGHEIVGAWLSMAAACASICWMLRAWVPPRWALLGGWLSTLHPTIISWGQSYWGGSLALLGGSLVLGALPRALSRDRLRIFDGLAFGAGMAVLANTRPFEGAVLSLFASATLVFGVIVRGRPQITSALVRFALPAAVVLTLTFSLMGFYNHSVTGDFRIFPYLLYESQYSSVPLFLGMTPKPTPHFNHRVLETFDAAWLKELNQFRTPAQLVRRVAMKLAFYSSAFFPVYGILFFIFQDLSIKYMLLQNVAWVFPQQTLLYLPRILSEPRVRLAVAIGIGFTVLALLSTSFEQHHYAAPAVGIVILLTIHALRHLRTCRFRGRRIGRLLCQFSILLCFAWVVVGPASRKLVPRREFEGRSAILAKLELKPGNHLIIVRYGENNVPGEEWVYNRANIDRAKVVWAREMDVVSDGRLLEYYRDRDAWLLETDQKPPELRPYRLEMRAR